MSKYDKTLKEFEKQKNKKILFTPGPASLLKENITGLDLSLISLISSTKIAPIFFKLSTTCLLWTISCLTYTGEPNLSILFFTISIALSTPAQKPLGDAK